MSACVPSGMQLKCSMVRLWLVTLLLLGSLALPSAATVVLNSSNSKYYAQLANNCSRAYDVDVTSDSILAMTFSPPVCRAFFGGDTGTQCSDANELSNSHTVTVSPGAGTSSVAMYVRCVATGTVEWTVTGASGSTDSKLLNVYNFSAPISNELPLVLYENACTSMLFALDRQLAQEVSSPAVTLSPHWKVQGSCFMYSDSSCVNKVSSAAMTTTAGKGTSLTAYFKCAAANADVTLDPFFFLYGGARWGPPAVVMSPHPYVAMNLSGPLGIDDTLLSTPVVAVRDFFWSIDVPSLVQLECSSALVGYAAPYASQRWLLGLAKSKSDCTLYADPYCAVPLANDVLSIMGSSAAVFIRCRTGGSLTVTAVIQGGAVTSSVMTVACTSSGSVFDFFLVSLSESNPFPAVSNTLTLTIRPSTTSSLMVAGDSITVNGLVSMSTVSTASLPVSGAQAGLFDSTAVWSQASGTLILTVAAGKTVPTSSDTVVSFTLTNPSTFKNNSQLYFTTSKSLKQWPASPLLASGWAGFAVKTIFLFDNRPGYVTGITVTLRPNRPLSGPETITIADLGGLRIESSEVLRGAGASLFAYEWSDADGTFTLTLLSGKVMPSDSDTELWMRVVNPAVANNGIPSVQLGTSPIQRFDSTITVTGPSKFFVYFSSNLTAREDNPVPGAANRVKVTFKPELSPLLSDMKLYIQFSPPLSIPSGTINLNPSSDMSPLPIAATGLYNVFGILTVPITRTISTTTTSSVTVDFTNPSSKNDGFGVDISVDPTVSADPYSVVRTSKPGTASAAFQKLEMVETLRTASVDNNLIFRLRPSFDIPFEKMEIGPFSWVSSIRHVKATGVSLRFDTATKRVVLTASSMRALVAGKDYIFSFTINNPATAQSGAIALYFSSDLGLPATYFADVTTQSSFSLSTSPHGLDNATIAESSDVVRQLNTLTFTFKPTATVTSGTNVYIRGLYRSQYPVNEFPSVQSLAVTGEHAELFESVASYTEDAGTLVLTVAAGQSIGSTVTASFAISLLNPDVSQFTSSPEISIDNTNYVMLAGFVLGAPVNPPGPQDTKQCPSTMFGMTQCGISIRTVQKLPPPSARADPGSMLFTLRPSLDVLKTTKIILSGLNCIVPYDGAVTITDVPEVVATSGIWNGTAGTLTLTVTAADGMLSTQTYSFQVSVLDVDQICEPKVSLKNTDVLTWDHTDAMPLLNLITNTSASFASSMSTVLVAENSTALGESNTLTFWLRPRFQLAAGSTILIDSLYPSTTSTLNAIGGSTSAFETLTIAGADAAIFGFVASWTQSQGTLLLTVAAGQTMTASRDNVISVTFTNPQTLKVPVVPRVWVNYETPVPANRGVLGGALPANNFSAVVCLVCGDGMRTSEERCDDGNTINGDGCSSFCEVESGYTCTGGSPTTADTCVGPPSTGAPVFVTLAVSSITSASFLLSIQVDVSSTVYYVLDSSTSATPSMANIKNLKNAGGGHPLRSAKIQYDVSSAQIDKFVLLFGNSKPVKYNLYIYVVNKATGIGQASVTTLLVDVSAPPSKTVIAPISINSTVNVASTVVVTLSEAVPTGNLKVNLQLAGPQSSTTTVTPTSLVFAGPKVSLSYTVVGKAAGVVFVIYTLSGTSADEYAPPAQTTCSFGGSDILVKPLVSGQTSVDLQVSGHSKDNAASSEVIQIQFDPSTIPDITSLRLQYVTFDTKSDSKSTADGEQLQNPFDSNQGFAGTSFSLSAYSSTDLRESTALDSPLLINASYTYLDTIQAAVSEKQSAVLKYYDIDTQSWVVASESCPEALRLFDNSIASSMLSVNVCHLTQFAIFYTVSASGSATAVDVALIVGLCFAGAGTVLLLVLIKRIYNRRKTMKDQETKANGTKRRNPSAPARVVLPVPMYVLGQSQHIHPAGCSCHGCTSVPLPVSIPSKALCVELVPVRVTATGSVSAPEYTPDSGAVPDHSRSPVPIAVPLDFLGSSEAKEMEESAPLSFREILLSVPLQPLCTLPNSSISGN